MNQEKKEAKEERVTKVHLVIGEVQEELDRRVLMDHLALLVVQVLEDLLARLDLLVTL